MPPWYAAALARGPDVRLDVTVASGDEAGLRALVQATPLPGFVRAEGASLWAVDEGHATLLDSLVHGTAPDNVWIYHCITVEGPTLSLDRGYGGTDRDAPGTLTDSEDALVRALLDASLTVVRWTLTAGAPTYNTELVAEGHDRDSLRNFLSGAQS